MEAQKKNTKLGPIVEKHQNFRSEKKFGNINNTHIYKLRAIQQLASNIYQVGRY